MLVILLQQNNSTTALSEKQKKCPETSKPQLPHNKYGADTEKIKRGTILCGQIVSMSTWREHRTFMTNHHYSPRTKCTTTNLMHANNLSRTASKNWTQTRLIHLFRDLYKVHLIFSWRLFVEILCRNILLLSALLHLLPNPNALIATSKGTRISSSF